MKQGRTAEASLRMHPPHTAEALLHSPGQDFPAVPAISTLVELMELAAARLMLPQLAHAESSVSLQMDLRHIAAVHAGGSWRAVATYRARRGRLHEFDVDVFDASGLIASAVHVRAVVVERRVLAVARRRAGRPAMLLRP
jgi:predicted thioesterase